LEATVQYLAALAMAGLTAWAITVVGSGTLDRAAAAFALLVGGWRPDPWPRGVQEEDRDRPWSGVRRAVDRIATAGVEEGTRAVPVTRIRPRTRPR
jgi:hypothetical protein